jgi:hypothetical protein
MSPDGDWPISQLGVRFLQFESRNRAVATNGIGDSVASSLGIWFHTRCKVHSMSSGLRQRASNANKKFGQNQPMDNESSGTTADTIQLSNVAMIFLGATTMVSNRCDG